MSYIDQDIDLLKFRGNLSTAFTGRPEGEKAREELNLDVLDMDKFQYTFVIPSGTTAFNPSFYLGLLFDSIKNLGINKFEEKYTLKIGGDNMLFKNQIIMDIEEGRRHALNAIGGNTGLSFFIKKIYGKKN